MSADTPPNGQPSSPPGMDLSNYPGATPSAIPLNPPAGNAAIPVNAPRSAPGYAPAPVPGQSPYSMPGQAAPGYAPLNAAQNAPAPSNPYGTPQPAASLNGTPLNGAPTYGNAAPSPYAPPMQPGQYPAHTGQYPAQPGQYPAQPGQYPAQPGQYPAMSGAANPYPPQMPTGYQVPNQPPNPIYNTPQNMGYRPLSSEAVSSGPNIAMGALTGILLMIVCGLGFGFISVAAGFRIPYLSLGIGYLIGYAVLKASKENGDVQGIIGGVCSLLACLIGLGIMYMNGVFISPFAFIIAAFATYRGYSIPAEG